MKYVIIGTAGHIDHGKTSLVKALTGVDTDRLPEEKERGITIDIGFAHSQLTENLKVSFVDVPGHERLVKNMIAGACGIDMVLLVIAADEGVMPQTVEHLNICEVLGIDKGVVALTKIDKVDRDKLAEVVEEVRLFLQDTSFRDAPVVPVSSKTGEGLDELIRTIEGVALQVERKRDVSAFRMPVDRVFVVKGFGTVVTGTVFSGKVELKDEIEILPQRIRAKVRNIQVQGEDVERSQAGFRTAVNLQGVEASQIERGDVLVQPGMFRSSQIVDCRIRLFRDAKPLKDLAPVRVHVATKEAIGRVKFLDREALKPGEWCYCRIHLDEPIVAANGEPVVIRSYSPIYTIGGGTILDAVGDGRRIKRSVLANRLERLDGRGDADRAKLFLDWAPKGMELDELRLKLLDPARAEEIVKDLMEQGLLVKAGSRLFSTKVAEKIKDRIKEIVATEAQRDKLFVRISYKEISHKLGLPEDVIRDLAFGIEGVKVDSKGLSFGEDREDVGELVYEVEKAFEKAGLTVPAVDEVFDSLGITDKEEKRRILRYLIENKVLVRVSMGIVVHKKHINRLISEVNRFFEKRKEMKVSDFKNIFGLSRKYAIPYLEFLDKIGLTKRVGNVRKKR